MPRISALPPNTSPDGDDELPGVDDSTSTTVKWTLTTIKTWLQSLAGWITTAMVANRAVTSEKLESTIAFKAYNTATQSIQATPSALALATEEYDIGSNFSASAFTAPVSGVYHFTGRLAREGNTTAYTAIALYVDRGSGYVEEARGGYIVGNPANSGVTVASDLKLAATDKVQLYGWANGTVSGLGTTKALAYFTGHLVGQAT